MTMIDLDGKAAILADSQVKSVGLDRLLAATWRSVCIHQMNRVNSCHVLTMMTVPVVKQNNDHDVS